MIIELVNKLYENIEAIEALKDNEDYTEALRIHKENNALTYGGYSLNTPRYIDNIFEEYVKTLTKIEEYRENDKNYLRTISDLGKLAYLYEK